MSTVNILAVEDDEVDLMSLQRAFKKLKIANPIIHAENGEEALTILRGQHTSKILGKPYIILLDLNMPVMNGLEFLEVVRHDPILRPSIIFVMTTSSDERDRFAAYEKNVAGYILKEQFGDSFLDAVTMIEHFWRVVELPPLNNE